MKSHADLIRFLESAIKDLTVFCRYADPDEFLGVVLTVEECYLEAAKLGYTPEKSAPMNPYEGLAEVSKILAWAREQNAMLSLSEAARYLGMSESGLRKLVKRNEIRFWQAGSHGRIRFRAEWLQEFVDGKNDDVKPKRKTRIKAAPIEPQIEPQFGFDPSLLNL